MGILNIGSLSLQANLVALQTIGNNISNVNTPGYSRQRVVQEAVAGQFTGSGYVGRGVEIQTIARSYDQFLTRQSALAATTQAADVTRSDYLKQLSDIFQGGSNGIGASVNDMLNSFSDVANTPTDLTARTVALTRVDETARRLRAASQSLDDLQAGISQTLTEKINAVNSLAQSIAQINGQIALAQGTGQPPNDLLDKRDQLIRNLNDYVQTTQVAADDGSVGVYIGGSQSLVLGIRAASVTLGQNDFGDPLQSKLVLTREGASTTLDDTLLGGGQIAGLLRFQNNDLVEGRNLLGRLTTAVTTQINDAHKLGLDLKGNVGTNLFSPVSVDVVLPPQAPATLNGGSAAMHVAIADPTQFVASDYQIDFLTGSTGTITRKSDNQVQAFDLAAPATLTFDGLKISNSGGAAQAGDRFYLKPFSGAANTIKREFSTPSALAVASPVVGKMGSNNTGSLKLGTLVTGVNPPSNVPVTLTFTSANQYTRSDTGATVYNYTSGTPILGGGTPNAWTLNLQGAPQAGDSFAVRDIKDPTLHLDLTLNGGNASAMMALRDKPTFDGAAMSDGYAGLISQIGIRAQSANYAATVSTTIATNAEAARTGVAGVNLDEEAGKLLQYQQSYQASAKMIQIAQNIFDTLIQSLAR